MNKLTARRDARYASNLATREVDADAATDEPPSLTSSLPSSPDFSESPVTPFPLEHFLAKRLPRCGPRSRAFRKAYFPEVKDREWHDWHWQLRHTFRTAEELARVMRLTEDEKVALERCGSLLPVAVTPYYLSVLDPEDSNHSLRRTVVPVQGEFLRTRGEADDPLDEDAHSPVPGLVHRYPDRVLFLVLDRCATYCRYCTRSRVVGQGEINAGRGRWEESLAYIRSHPEIRDVLLSGGDPLTLSDDRLDWLLGELRRIPHVQFIRIGTKVPAVLPQRITPKFVKMLRRHHPLWLSVHFLHPDECTPEAVAACRRLADAGIPLGSQTVLLKSVNDDVAVMKQLMQSMLMMRVRPYYLYQCDPISGSSHFRTTVAKGLEIIRGLRGWTTGYGVPTYVIDAPGGGGKIPLQPDYLVGREGDDVLLRSYTGEIHRYPDAPEKRREVVR